MALGWQSIATRQTPPLTTADPSHSHHPRVASVHLTPTSRALSSTASNPRCSLPSLTRARAQNGSRSDPIAADQADSNPRSPVGLVPHSATVPYRAAHTLARLGIRRADQTVKHRLIALLPRSLAVAPRTHPPWKTHQTLQLSLTLLRAQRGGLVVPPLFVIPYTKPPGPGIPSGCHPPTAPRHFGRGTVDGLPCAVRVPVVPLVQRHTVRVRSAFDPRAERRGGSPESEVVFGALLQEVLRGVGDTGSAISNHASPGPTPAHVPRPGRVLDLLVRPLTTDDRVEVENITARGVPLYTDARGLMGPPLGPAEHPEVLDHVPRLRQSVAVAVRVAVGARQIAAATLTEQRGEEVSPPLYDGCIGLTTRQRLYCVAPDGATAEVIIHRSDRTDHNARRDHRPKLHPVPLGTPVRHNRAERFPHIPVRHPPRAAAYAVTRGRGGVRTCLHARTVRPLFPGGHEADSIGSVQVHLA